MPAQKPIIVPPYAILDPDICSEFGSPVFAWHPFSFGGKIGVAGGGTGVSRCGGPQRRGASADTNQKFANGGVVTPSTSNGLKFGRCTEIEFTGPFSVWIYAKPSTAFQTGAFLGCLNTAGQQGWELNYSSTPSVRMNCASGTAANYISTDAVTIGNIITLMAGANPGVAWGSMYLNGKSQVNNGGAANPNTPSYATGLTLGIRVSGGIGGQTVMYGAMVWRKFQPQRLAVMLDYDPDLMWWWPGKKKALSFSIPASGVPGAYYRMLQQHSVGLAV